MSLAAAVLLLGQAGGVKFGAINDPLSGQIVLQATVKAPYALGEREEAAWRIIGESLINGTEEFTRDKLLYYGSQAGIPPQVSVTSDLIQIQVTTPKGGLDVGAQIIEAMLMRPVLKPEDARPIADRLLLERVEPWHLALQPNQPAYRRMAADLPLKLHTTAFRPGNISISAGGAVDLEGLKAEFKGRLRDLGEPMARGSLLYDRPSKHPVRHILAVSTLELRGRLIHPNSPSVSPDLLAVYALGAGKTSSLFRVVREELQLSYKQELILWPSSRGWIPRILIQTTAESASVESARKALQADVESWGEADLDRIKAIASAMTQQGSQYSPLWADATGPVSTKLSDRVKLRGWLIAVGAPEFSLRTLSDAWEQVSLDSLKQSANRLLTEAEGAVITAG
jgi:hypothetical protein